MENYRISEPPFTRVMRLAKEWGFEASTGRLTHKLTGKSISFSWDVTESPSCAVIQELHGREAADEILTEISQQIVKAMEHVVRETVIP